MADSFSDYELTYIIVTIFNLDGQVYNKHAVPLIHFREKRLNMEHLGQYNFIFHPIESTDNKRMTIEIQSGDQDKLYRQIQVSLINS